MSDEPAPNRRPHPIRLTVLMLICAGIALLFSPVAGGRDPSGWQSSIPLISAIGGSLGGIALEFFVRWGQRD
jgi:hypothetical protein